MKQANRVTAVITAQNEQIALLRHQVKQLQLIVKKYEVTK